MSNNVYTDRQTIPYVNYFCVALGNTFDQIIAKKIFVLVDAVVSLKYELNLI